MIVLAGNVQHPTGHPAAAGGAGRRAALFVAAVVAVLGLSACGGGSEERTIEIVVPAGTQELLDAGEKVAVMPDRIELRVGDTLVLRNEDSVRQLVGPYLVDAEDERQFSWGSPGTFWGYCALSENYRYEIVVTN